MKKVLKNIKLTLILLIGVFSSFSALAQCVTPVITSIGNSGPACEGTSVTLNASGTVNGVSSSFIRVAGIGANFGNQEMNVVFSSGDRAGSMTRMTNATFATLFAGQTTNSGRATAIKSSYDVLLFTWASPPDANLTWGLIDAYLSIGGSVFWEDDRNIGRLNDGTPNSLIGTSQGGSYGCGYTLVSPAPFPSLVANGVNGCFANHHLSVSSWPSWMKVYIKGGGGENLGVAGVHPTGGGRFIVQGPDQDFHARRAGGSTELNQYKFLLNQMDFLAAEQTGISWTGPNGFTSNEANPILTNITPAMAGVYTAKLTNVTGGGCFVTATTNVIVNSAEVPTITASGKTNLCPGNSVTLTASVGGSYLWNNGSNNRTITVSTAGNYTVKVMGSNGCLGTSLATTVNVNNSFCNQAPVAVAKSIIVSAGNDCSGIASASDFDGGSTDADGDALTYSVSPAGPYSIGITSVVLTVTDTKGASSTSTATVTVLDVTAPSVITKNISVDLAGGTASITASDVNNGSFDNCSIASITIDKSTFDCSSIGNQIVTLTVTDASGNVSTGTATVTIVGELTTSSIASVPTIATYTGGVSTNLYLGYGAQSTTLQVSNVASGGTDPRAYTYVWTGSASSQLSSTTSASPVFTPTVGGYYTFNVLVTNKYGCKSSASITICVKDIREKDKNGRFTGKVFICHAPPGNPSNNNTLSISVNAVASHLSQHSDDRLGSCSDAPCAAPSNMMMSTNSTGGSVSAPTKVAATEFNLNSTEMVAYPNPFTQQTTVRFTLPYQEDHATLDIYDLKGVKIQTLFNGNANAQTTYEVQFNGQNLSAGTYFFRLITAKEVKSFKVVMNTN
jgi:hypothetical protein